MNDEKNILKSEEQTLKLFEEFIRKDNTVNFIKKYRKYLNLPPQGVRFTKKYQKILDSDVFDGFLFMPKEHYKKFPSPEREKPIKVFNTCWSFVKQSGIESTCIATLFRLYFFFNQTIKTPIRMFSRNNDLAKIEYLPLELSEYDKEDCFMLEFMYCHFEETSKTHPVAIYINPEITQNQLKDFISHNWDYIKKIQEERPKVFEGIRRKRKQEINDFIYENRALPLEKIFKKLSDEMGVILDHGHISKIRNIEKKRRS
jgi:hypothetical protein